RMTRFYNPNKPDGVAVDGKNDTVFGNLDDPCNDNYNGNNLGTGVAGQDPNQLYRQLYQEAMICQASPYHQSVNIADPTFAGANAALSWSETAGPWGTIVDRQQIDQATDLTPGGLAQSLVAVPYYRDDSCFDDGTGVDPGPRLKPGDANEPRTTSDGTARKCWSPSDGIPQPGDARFYQGDIATHGLHLLFQVESDNARQTVPIDEIVSENRMVMLPGQQGNVGEQYGREFEKPLVGVVQAFDTNSPGADGGTPAAGTSSTAVDAAHSGKGNDQGGDSVNGRTATVASVTSSACKPPNGFAVALAQPHGGRIVAAKAYVDGALAASRRGRRVTSISVPHLIQADQTVRIVAVTDRGKRITTTRLYRGCVLKASHKSRAHRAHKRRRAR
ncbi:MAG: hypothetical protein ACJ77M_15735, partial [Thermoleophilaceae bacterium]